MYKIEFLVIVSKSNTNSLRSLKSLLQSDDDIEKVTSSKITVRGFEFGYRIETGKINADKEPTYFVLHFECSEESEIPEFVKSIRTVRSVLSIVNPTVYKLWDDVSQHYAEAAYSKIYRVENLMRKLLTKFMYINLGINWTSDRMPEDVAESINSGNKDPNFLHNVDFSQLSNFLFSEKFPNHKESLIKKLSKAESIEQLNLTEIKSLLPESNWSRYFETLVDCDDEFLSKRWEKLRLLRNAVAHSRFISIGDLNQIEDLTDEITPFLEEAINKLSNVIVPEDEIENVVENVASEQNEKIGSFINSFKKLEDTLSKINNQINASNNSIQKRVLPISQSLKAISQSNLVPQETIDAIKRISEFRNRLMHSSSFDIQPFELNSRINEVIQLTESMSDQIEVNEEYHINRIKDKSIVKIYEKIKEYALSLPGVEIKYNKHYITFRLDKNITDIKIQQKSVKVWINANYGEVSDPKNITKNVKEIGHQGNGDYEILIKDDEILPNVFDLIRQSYEINKE
jgi:predicted transport protein